MTKLTEVEPKKAEAVKVKAKEETKAPVGITVKNLRKTWFVQPSTQTRINVGAEVLIANDGWAQNQIAAGFFEVVK